MNYSKGYNNNDMYSYDPYGYKNNQIPVMGVTCMNGMPHMTNMPIMPNLPGMPPMNPYMPFMNIPGMPMEMPNMEMPMDFMPDGDMPALPANPQEMFDMMGPGMNINCQQILELARAMGCLENMNGTEPTEES